MPIGVCLGIGEVYIFEKFKISSFRKYNNYTLPNLSKSEFPQFSDYFPLFPSECLPKILASDTNCHL